MRWPKFKENQGNIPLQNIQGLASVGITGGTSPIVAMKVSARTDSVASAGEDGSDDGRYQTGKKHSLQIRKLCESSPNSARIWENWRN